MSKRRNGSRKKMIDMFTALEAGKVFTSSIKCKDINKSSYYAALTRAANEGIIRKVGPGKYQRLGTTIKSMKEAGLVSAKTFPITSVDVERSDTEINLMGSPEQILNFCRGTQDKSLGDISLTGQPHLILSFCSKIKDL